MSRESRTSVNASVIDLFCGAGGLAHGFRLEGFPLAAGVDLDQACRYPFEANNGAEFLQRDVSTLTASELEDRFHPGKRRVLVGCTPCQPFSVYNQKNADPQWKLLGKFGRLIAEMRPDVVSMENVPRLVNFRGGTVFSSFVSTLERAGYSVWWAPIFCPDYGVPQTRTRLVLLASLLGPIELEAPTHTPDRYATVRDAIRNCRRLRAGRIDPFDRLHRSSRLSPTNLERIKEAKPGKTWRDWSEELVTECHRRATGRGYASVYGRMTWDRPSPTITTQFYGFGNGRFGHPQSNRAISLREGAILQSFPKRYKFAPPDEDIHFKRLGRMIGNAVPVLLAQAIARSVREHLSKFP